MINHSPSLTLPITNPAHPWPQQGQWTYEDYLRLPDDGRRYEIIEGVLYVTNAPAYAHQFTVIKLSAKLDAFVSERQLGVVLAAPFEVHLPRIAIPVQPDILFIAAAQQPKPDAKYFEGAPDLIVEVLSPESIRRDQHIKFGAYERAGVREYWIANPKTRTITVHMLPAGGQEYVLLDQFAPGETLHSAILPDLQLLVDILFLTP
jgi:Uma2 family endonuclease